MALAECIAAVRHAEVAARGAWVAVVDGVEAALAIPGVADPHRVMLEDWRRVTLQMAGICSVDAVAAGGPELPHATLRAWVAVLAGLEQAVAMPDIELAHEGGHRKGLEGMRQAARLQVSRHSPTGSGPARLALVP